MSYPQPEQLTLGDLIAVLEQEDPAKRLALGFAEPHSYRGYYEDLAFEPRENVQVAEMLVAAHSALGVTFQGYKGGDYEMHVNSYCWLARYGDTGETIGRCLLHLMLATESVR